MPSNIFLRPFVGDFSGVTIAAEALTASAEVRGATLRVSSTDGAYGATVRYENTGFGSIWTRINALAQMEVINSGFSAVILKIYQNGSVENATGAYGVFSDERLKEHVATARGYLADLRRLRVIKYALRSEGLDRANMLGLLAQEVEQVFPGLVNHDSEGLKSIKLSLLVPMLLTAVQELAGRVEALEARATPSTAKKEAA